MISNIELFKTIPFQDNYLHVHTTTDQTVWFKATEVAAFLQIGNIRDKLNSIKAEWKAVGQTDTLGGNQTTTFINEPALYEVILTLRLPNDESKYSDRHRQIRQFKDWIFETVIPTLRKSMMPPESALSLVQIEADRRLRTYEVVHRVFTSIGMDERDEIMFRDYGRNLMVNDCSKPLQEMTISERVSFLFGKLYKKSQLITVGKLMASEYRRLHDGVNPPKRSQYVDGATRPVSSYSIEDFETWGDRLIQSYEKKLDIDRRRHSTIREITEEEDLSERS
jgi:prophage antirepressor-like protein